MSEGDVVEVNGVKYSAFYEGTGAWLVKRWKPGYAPFECGNEGYDETILYLSMETGARGAIEAAIKRGSWA